MPSRQPLTAQTPKPKLGLIFISITIFASLLILFALFYLLYYYFISRSRTTPCDSQPPSPLPKLHRFTYKELKSATHNFRHENLIGKGGSCTVFRGILHNGKLVAVKLLDAASFQAEREFHNELQVLGGLGKKSNFLVSLLGYCVEKRKRLVVYEYMPNKSLQESLFDESCASLSWERRFQIVLDVSRALEFLHLQCHPPVVHGDVKPSNVLLDSDYRAKLSDFGLSRLKIDGEFGVDNLFSGDLGKSQDLLGNSPGIETPVGSPNEVDFALALQTSSLSKNKALSFGSLNHSGNVINGGDNVYIDMKGKGVFENVENGGEDWNKIVSFDGDHSTELNVDAGFAVNDANYHGKVGKKQWGKDWWWKQDVGGAELCATDYVREWIGSQICSSVNADEWDEDRKNCPRKSPRDNSIKLEKIEDANETQCQGPGVECIDTYESRGWKSHSNKQRKMQEWWKEEHLDELSKKGVNRLNSIEKKSKKGFRMRFFQRRKRKTGETDDGDAAMEFSFRKMSKKKDGFSGGSELWSGDLFSRELSSTTSMRGTLCYVAPEFGGCGYLMEKADIYSLGVLILVIVSGRRPLHVLASPMKLEKANLISWCRQLAQGGDILELVDERLKDEHRYNKEQASLCINLALACLQKMPELRPDIGDTIKILSGEMDLPPLPFEFSPSPPTKSASRSRRKHKNNAE